MAGGVAKFGLIDQTIFRLIVDRAAKQFSLVYNAFLTINTTGANPSGGGYEDRTTLSQNIDFEIPVLSTANAADDNFSLASCVRGGIPAWGSIISAISNHFSRVAYLGGYDGYLVLNDLRVSDYFNQIYYYSTGSYLLARNVFSETEDNFGTFRVVDNTPPSGAYEFIAGVNYGSGAGYYAYQADGNYFAPTRLKARIVTVGGGGGMSDDLDIRVYVMQAGGVIPTTQVVSISAGSTVGEEYYVGSLSSDKYLQVTGITFVDPASIGTTGDKIQIVNEKERVVNF